MYAERWQIVEVEFRASLAALHSAEAAFIDAVVEKRRRLYETFAGDQSTRDQGSGGVVALPFSRSKGALDRLEQDLHQVGGLDEARSAVVAAQDHFSSAARRLVETGVDTPELLASKLSALMLLQSRAREQSYPEILSNPEDRLAPIDYLTHLNGPGGLSDVLMSVRADVWLFARKADERRAG